MSGSIHFTLITPTFNRPEALVNCLKSVFKQTYPHWDMIVINDGSSQSYALAADYLNHSRLTYLEQDSNHGVNAARNRALNWVKNQANHYVCFLDDDETLKLDALETACQLIIAKKVPWLVLQCYLNNDRLTHMAHAGKMDYINDYLYGNKLKKDATHFIQAPLALSFRFNDWVKNGEEWTYFSDLASKSTLWAEPVPVKYNLHQPTGLFLGNMYGKNLLKPFIMKLYRPYKAVSLRPLNLKAWLALLQQVLKLPFRLPQIAVRSLLLRYKSSSA